MRRDWTKRGKRAYAGSLLVMGAAVAWLCAPLRAQTHKVTAPQDVVRAVGVYEWTGDMAKPAGSRLIPISLFIDDKLEDAAVYLARPVPFALLTGNVYELQKTGVPQGTLDLDFARHLTATATAMTAYDDGWFGYGKFAAPAAPKPSTLKPVKTLAKINAIDEDNDDQPHFSARSATPGSGGAATPAPGSAPASDTPADDPGRPTLHRPTDTSASSDSTSGGSTSANDPDRPTLRRHAAEPAKGAKGDQGEVDPVAGTLIDDPNRPTLHRGKAEGAPTDADIPKLIGLPSEQDLHQMVAVSDAADRPMHDFSRLWDDENEHQAILAKMETAARAALTAYETVNKLTPAETAPAAAPTPAKPAAHSTTARRMASKPAPVPPPPPPEALLDAKLLGYTLSYGGAATFVFSAHTDGLGSAQRFVTLVSQVNMQGEPEVVLKNVTDAAHLDRTPRMRLVDVVDAEASNRASLLFELRAQNSRQFALYRVLGGRADQLFLTGSTE